MSSDLRSNLYVVSSPSGGGKTTLVKRALQRADRLVLSVSYTTRAPRADERNGVEYFFVPASEFNALRDRGDFLEWAEVHGHFYGTSRKQVEQSQRSGMDLILDIDVQGARQVRATMPDAVLIFILPPDYETLKQRLVRRSSDGRVDIENRLKNAHHEVKAWNEFDYVVVNDDLERAADALVAIIQADRQRLPRQSQAVHEILESFGG